MSRPGHEVLPLSRSADPAETAPQTTTGNMPEITVGELSGALKRTIEDRFGLVRVRGEISNYRGPHSSGHAYFCLKDDSARIDAVVWKTTFLRLKTKPQEGLEVVATGRVTTFPGKSTYQIVIEAIEPAGVGALMAILEARRKTLAAEGLFDESRKKPIPFLPGTIGVVTSPTGAVIRDIIHRISDRFPRNILVWPVRVQGETAAAEVAEAIAGFNQIGGAWPRPDVLIIARGGGSLEDLWAFNEEVVVRAAAASAIPLISAIGHETDWTLIDHVADLRAPTPSGAAEKAVPVRAELMTQQADLSRRHVAGMGRIIDWRRNDMRALARALPAAETIVDIPRQRLDRADARLVAANREARDRRRLDLVRLAHRLSQQAPRMQLAQKQHQIAALEQRMRFHMVSASERRTRLLHQDGQRLVSTGVGLRREVERANEATAKAGDALLRAVSTGLLKHAENTDRLGRLLETLGYRQVLARGFALVRDASGRPVRSVRDVTAPAALAVEFADGHIDVRVGNVRGRAAKPAVKLKSEQGWLF